jgi:large subunit ribosomal protein L14e
MSTIEVGSICIKTCGREAGCRCVIVDVVDKNFALVTGPPKITGVKRRRVNIKHLEKTGDKVNIMKGSTDEEVAQVLNKSKPEVSKSQVEIKRKSTRIKDE